MNPIASCLIFPSICLVAGLMAGHHSQKATDTDPRVCTLAIAVLLLGIASLSNTFQSTICRLASF